LIKKVRVENENIIVRAKKLEIKPSRRTKPMVEYNVNDKRLFLIIGGGAAGVTCAETLRQIGYKGPFSQQLHSSLHLIHS
jgi:heterodisulfide reductase subunit A-like polyferredoxin